MTFQNPDKGRSVPLWAFGAVAAMLVVLLGVVAWLVLGPNEAEPEAAGPTPETEETAPAVPQEAQSKCGLEGYETEGRVLDTPTVSEWSVAGTTRVPTSSTAGPAEETTCFAHTPEGAVFAATTFFGASTSASTRLEAIEDMAIPNSPGQQAALKSDESTNSGIPGQMSLYGFRLDSYTGDTAQVSVATEYSESGESADMAMNYDLTWMDGDWKVELSDDGAPLREPQSLSDFETYVPWGGE